MRWKKGSRSYETLCQGFNKIQINQDKISKHNNRNPVEIPILVQKAI